MDLIPDRCGAHRGRHHLTPKEDTEDPDEGEVTRQSCPATEGLRAGSRVQTRLLPGSRSAPGKPRRAATPPAGPGLSCCPPAHSALCSQGQAALVLQMRNGRREGKQTVRLRAQLAGARKTLIYTARVGTPLTVKDVGTVKSHPQHTLALRPLPPHILAQDPSVGPDNPKTLQGRSHHPPGDCFPLWPKAPPISYFFRNREASTVCFPSSSSESESEDVEPVSQSSSSSESSESSSSSLEKEERESAGKRWGGGPVSLLTQGAGIFGSKTRVHIREPARGELEWTTNPREK